MNQVEASNYKIPQEGLKGLIENWKSDLLAGFIVFLISLPSCLGVSMASGFPAIAGVLTAIVGGIIVTFFHGSYVAVKAPAAGLIVIVLSCVETLGKGNLEQGVKLTAAVIVVSGLIQILLGVLRAGTLGDFFPASSVHGMLAAIGVMIVAKEIHKIFGVNPQSKDSLSLLAELPDTISNMNPKIALIGIVSLTLLFLIPVIKNGKIKKIPAPLIVLVLAVLLGTFIGIKTPHKYLFLNKTYQINMDFLVHIPDGIVHYFMSLPAEIWNRNAGPDFSELFSGDSIYFIIMLTAIGSLETLVITNGVDNLDPFKRKSHANKDLTAVGIGNTICGLLGVLPMISELVRSSANIDNGAKTRWSGFFQGLFLLLFVTLAPYLIRQIPLAVLGAMLVYTGYRLASPQLFINTYKIGKEQFMVFITALLITLIVDPVTGVLSGLIVEYIFYAFYVSDIRSLLKNDFKVEQVSEKKYNVHIYSAAIFSGTITLKKILGKIPSGSLVQIELSNAKIIDHTFLRNIHDYDLDYKKTGGTILISGLEKFKSFSSHPLSFKYQKE